MRGPGESSREFTTCDLLRTGMGRGRIVMAQFILETEKIDGMPDFRIEWRFLSISRTPPQPVVANWFLIYGSNLHVWLGSRG